MSEQKMNVYTYNMYKANNKCVYLNKEIKVSCLTILIVEDKGRTNKNNFAIAT